MDEDAVKRMDLPEIELLGCFSTKNLGYYDYCKLSWPMLIIDLTGAQLSLCGQGWAVLVAFVMV